MFSKSYSFFGARNSFEITGKLPNSPDYAWSMRAAAATCIQALSFESEEENHLQHASQLRLLALLGCEAAINFFAQDVESPKCIAAESMAVRAMLGRYLIEVADITNDPRLNYRLYQLYTADCEASVFMPDIASGMAALEKAARAKGVAAIQAAATLAHLCAAEYRMPYQALDTTHRFCSLSVVYLRFKNRLNFIANVEEKRSAEIAGTLTLGGLGCVEAMLELYSWYTFGDEELNIEPDDAGSLLWQEMIIRNDIFLKQQFLKYFEMSVVCILQNGMTGVHCQSPLEFVRYLMEVYTCIKMREVSRPIMIYEALKRRFVAEAQKNNAYAAELLAKAAQFGLAQFTCVSHDESRYWNTKIIENMSVTGAVVARAARSLYELSNRVVPQTNHLLQRACQYGCAVSATDLGVQALARQDFTSAKKYFDLALRLSHDAVTAVQIIHQLTQANSFSKVGEFQYCYELLAVTIKSGLLAGKVFHSPVYPPKLEQEWSEIERQLWVNQPVNHAQLDRLVADTLDQLQMMGCDQQRKRNKRN